MHAFNLRLMRTFAIESENCHGDTSLMENNLYGQIVSGFKREQKINERKSLRVTLEKLSMWFCLSFNHQGLALIAALFRVDSEILSLLYLLVFQDIDLKTLVYEAYQKGAQELLYVVPFTAKVLESCAKSKVRGHCDK